MPCIITLVALVVLCCHWNQLQLQVMLRLSLILVLLLSLLLFLAIVVVLVVVNLLLEHKFGLMFDCYLCKCNHRS